MRLRFGECVLDTELHELTRAGRVVSLPPKAFHLLEILAERRPRPVPLAELRRFLWPEAVAGGTQVARLVSEVRSALGDRARRPHFIRTVHRLGYAFCATAVEEVSEPLRTSVTCALQWGNRLFPLAAGENLIGRTADALINVASSEVSRRHARIVVAGERATLEDLGSKNGTYLRGARVTEPRELSPDDLIELGSVRLIFRVTAEENTDSWDGEP